MRLSNRSARLSRRKGNAIQIPTQRRRLWPWLLLPLLAACAGDDGLSVVRAERGTLPLVMVESGEIAAVRAQYVRPPQEWQGSVVIVSMVPEGTIVAQGDTVAQLDASSLLREMTAVEDRLQNLAAQRAGVLAEQASKRQGLADAVEMAQLSREQAELQLAKLTFESQTRQQEARLAASRAAINLEESRAKLVAQTVLDSLAVAKADLELAGAGAEQKSLRERQRAMTLVAPLPGMVVYYEQEDRQGKRSKPRVGDTVDPWRPIVQIPDLSSMQVEMVVHEVDRHRLEVGMPVRLRLEAYPEAEFAGRLETIARLATEVEPDSGVRGFAVVARIDGADARLRPGMTAIVEIVLGEVADAILVPRTAVAERDGGLVVFPRATWPRPLPVRAAALTPLTVAVTEGLEAGTELVARPPKEES
jgi:multidrug efflux pump subunit AcrA (membrane-fusion protein)